RALTTGGFTDAYPSAAPDKQGLLFSSNRRGGSDLWRLDFSTGDLKRLTTSAGRKEHPCGLPPDGSWIAFTLVDDKGEYTHVMRSNGTRAPLLHPQLTERFAAVYHAEWSPDGSRLAAGFVTKDNRSAIGIATMDKETGTALEIKLLDLPGQEMVFPRWSPDGRFL